jgi:hypothetical protein
LRVERSKTFLSAKFREVREVRDDEDSTRSALINDKEALRNLEDQKLAALRQLSAMNDSSSYHRLSGRSLDKSS